MNIRQSADNKRKLKEIFPTKTGHKTEVKCGLQKSLKRLDVKNKFKKRNNRKGMRDIKGNLNAKQKKEKVEGNSEERKIGKC